MISPRGLDHVVLRVADLERSLRFYRDALGFPIERRLDELGLVQLRAGTALIDLVPVDAEQAHDEIIEMAGAPIMPPSVAKRQLN